MVVTEIVSQYSKLAGLKALLKHSLFEPIVPKHLSSRFLQLDKSQQANMEQSLRSNFFSQSPTDWLSTTDGKRDLQDHLAGRLEENRKYRIPWLDGAKSLAGARILEIGCGTGCSTVALAEQGAKVLAIDIDKLAVEDAKERCRLYGVAADFMILDATEIESTLASEKFDLIVFWACMEHLTIEERISAMQATWRMLRPGDLWCVTDSPNRLWAIDFHTSLLPFFMWLPDQLAVKYASQSPRDRFRKSFEGARPAEEVSNAELLKLARWGRGVSFHEFSVALMPAEQLPVVSCMESFNCHRLAAKTRWMFSRSRQYIKRLRAQCPDVHEGFFCQNLNILLRKE